MTQREQNSSSPFLGLAQGGTAALDQGLAEYIMQREILCLALQPFPTKQNTTKKGGDGLECRCVALCEQTLCLVAQAPFEREALCGQERVTGFTGHP